MLPQQLLQRTVGRKHSANSLQQLHSGTLQLGHKLVNKVVSQKEREREREAERACERASRLERERESAADEHQTCSKDALLYAAEQLFEQANMLAVYKRACRRAKQTSCIEECVRRFGGIS